MCQVIIFIILLLYCTLLAISVICTFWTPHFEKWNLLFILKVKNQFWTYFSVLIIGTIRLFVWENAVKVPSQKTHQENLTCKIAVKILSQKTHLEKWTCLCNMRVSWLYYISVNVKKSYSRKRTQLYGLWI